MPKDAAGMGDKGGISETPDEIIKFGSPTIRSDDARPSEARDKACLHYRSRSAGSRERGGNQKLQNEPEIRQ
jgi:hypothetical protein